MKYSDDPSLEDLPLFARHELVLQYLDTYGSEIRHLVKFQTQVHDVRQVSHDEKEGWLVCSRNVLSNEANEGHYDAVAVASGHYSVPTLPDIPGIKQWNEAYPRVITHSKSYRSPDAFTSQKVMIIGNSASGLDIAAQVGSVSKLPVIVSRRSETSLSLKSNTDWKLERPEIIEFLSPANDTRAVKFVDGTVESRIDRIVFCTGYYFSFPFFSSVKPPFITTGERVENLYKHLFSIDHPTIAFLGVPTKIVPFRTCEGQAAVVARVWSSRLNLPNKLKMKEWEVQRVADCGEGKRFHELKLLEDLAYHNEMVDWAKEASSNGVGRIPPKWSKRDEWTRCKVGAIKAAYMERGEARSSVRSMEELGFSYED
ncbi:MAG: hypothetical protein LQ342_002666 [Letrouitia transgressa]|nr:MAG: hypothetical protein LQ342_002666 [Letrouitia transgressa]